MYNINKRENIIPLQNGKLPIEISEMFRQISCNILCGEVTPITCYKKEINENFGFSMRKIQSIAKL